MGKINHDSYEEREPSGINCSEPGPWLRTPVEENPSSSISLTRELLRPFPKPAGWKVTANTAGKKRATAVLTSELGQEALS